MSVQGTILVIDGVSTNRIMLKVQLTAAWYHVVQGERVKGIRALLKHTRPDLVLTAQTLPDGTAVDVKKLLLDDPGLADIPVVAITPQNDKTARLRALADGLDDVLTYPFKDTLLMARVRSLLRASADTQDLHAGNSEHPIGFAEPSAALITKPKTARVDILTQSPRAGASWTKALNGQGRHNLLLQQQSSLQGVLSGPSPDAVIVDLDGRATGMDVLADLRSRSATRHTVLIGVLEDSDSSRASEALDRGADAVCLGGFCAQEVLLRLNNQINRKDKLDRMRASLRQGLADSWIDPLTGLHNRRYAMHALNQIVQQSARSGHSFAVMLADLDHFKSINDGHGHSGGDYVLTETAVRMQNVIGSQGLTARIGGEEFMIAIPRISRAKAVKLAEELCDSICATPFRLPGETTPIPVTISVGLRMSVPPQRSAAGSFDPVENLIRSADDALYAAKKAGRNQVSTKQNAA